MKSVHTPSSDAGYTLRRLRFLFIEGKPVFLWTLLALERIKWEGPVELREPGPPGPPAREGAR